MNRPTDRRLYPILTVVALMVLTICYGEESCSNLPQLENDDRQTVEPYDNTWWLVKSYIVNPCVNFQYLGNRDGKENLALMLFISRKGNWTVPANVVVSPSKDLWNATQANDINTPYRKLFIDNVNHYWCAYTCDADDKIDVFLCFARNAKGRELVNKELNTTYADLPWKKNATLFDSFPDSCLDLYSKPDDY